MNKDFNINYLLGKGVDIFAKDWKLLVGSFLVLFLPLYLLLFWTRNYSEVLGLIITIFLGLASVAFFVLLTKAVERRFMKNKPYLLSSYFKDLKHTYWKTLWTFVLVGLITFLVELVVFIIFVIIILILGWIFTLPTTAAQILASPWVLLGILFVLVSAVVFAILWTHLFFVSFITVLTKHKYFSSINRSIDLVKGLGWKTFGVIVIFQIIAMLINYVLSLIFFVVNNPLINILKSVLGQVIILPISIATVVWYLLRDKKYLSLNSKKKTSHFTKTDHKLTKSITKSAKTKSASKSRSIKK